MIEALIESGQTLMKACLILPLFVIARLLYSHWQRRQTVVAKIDGPQRSSLLLGNLVEFANSQGEDSASIEWFKKYGDVCRYKGFLGRDMLHIVDPKAIAAMLSQGLLFEKDFAAKPRIAAMFGQGLHSSVGETHRRLRRIMVPAFAWQHIAPYAAIFNKSAVDVRDRWIEQIKASPEGFYDINMGYYCSLAFLNALGEAAFGYDFDAFNQGSVTPLFKAMMYIECVSPLLEFKNKTSSSVSNQRTYRQILLESIVDQLPVWILHIVFVLPIAAGKALKRQVDIMRKIAQDLFNLGLVDAQSDSVSSRSDLLSTLVKANLSASPRYQLSAEEVQAQLMTFVTAGLSTVLSVHCQLFRQLSLNEKVQRTLRAEMLALGDHPSIEQLDRAEYLEIVIREALRVADFVPLERIAQKDCVLPLAKPIKLTDGTYIDHLPLKKGQCLAIPVSAVSRNPDRYGQDADEFRPERWLGEEGESLKNYHGLGPGSWNGLLSFGGGERSCIGGRFGLLELKVFAHMLITTFTFSDGSDEWTPRARLLER